MVGGSALRVAEGGAIDADGAALLAEAAEQRVEVGLDGDGPAGGQLRSAIHSAMATRSNGGGWARSLRHSAGV